jgi:hypothetical protein
MKLRFTYSLAETLPPGAEHPPLTLLQWAQAAVSLAASVGLFWLGVWLLGMH